MAPPTGPPVSAISFAPERPDEPARAGPPRGHRHKRIGPVSGVVGRGSRPAGEGGRADHRPSAPYARGQTGIARPMARPWPRSGPVSSTGGPRGDTSSFGCARSPPAGTRPKIPISLPGTADGGASSTSTSFPLTMKRGEPCPTKRVRAHPLLLRTAVPWGTWPAPTTREPLQTKLRGTRRRPARSSGRRGRTRSHRGRTAPVS